jgi:hypothetical protein
MDSTYTSPLTNSTSIANNPNSGGPEVAEHAKKNLISTIDRRLAICDDYEQAIKDAMVEEDTTIRKTGMLQPGSTAALALLNVKEGFVVVGDLGDSHVVLAERVPEKKGIWKAKCLSFAQKPWSKEERERIHDAGGKLNRVYGETRLGEKTTYKLPACYEVRSFSTNTFSRSAQHVPLPRRHGLQTAGRQLDHLVYGNSRRSPQERRLHHRRLDLERGTYC